MKILNSFYYKKEEVKKALSYLEHLYKKNTKQKE